MLLRRRPPSIADFAAEPAPGFKLVTPDALAVLGWLSACRIGYVLVGSVAEAARELAVEPGPVAVIPAPYLRNLERLTQALLGADARSRVGEKVATVLARLSPDRLMEDGHWSLRCGSLDLDVETRSPFRSRYQELLFEAHGLELAKGLTVQVAGPEDLERYAQLRRGRSAPEIRITRVKAAAAEPSPAVPPTSASTTSVAASRPSAPPRLQLVRPD